MRVRELIAKLKTMPETAAVIIPVGHCKWDYIDDVEMGIFYPHAMEYMQDDNNEDDVNVVLLNIRKKK